jgi:hypothetical protein
MFSKNQIINNLLFGLIVALQFQTLFLIAIYIYNKLLKFGYINNYIFDCYVEGILEIRRRSNRRWIEGKTEGLRRLGRGVDSFAQKASGTRCTAWLGRLQP